MRCKSDWLCLGEIYSQRMCFNHYRTEIRRAQTGYYERQQTKIDNYWAGVVNELGIEGANTRKVQI